MEKLLMTVSMAVAGPGRTRFYMLMATALPTSQAGAYQLLEPYAHNCPGQTSPPLDDDGMMQVGRNYPGTLQVMIRYARPLT